MSLGRGNTIFSSLDLLSGYWQLPMAPESREITVFSKGKGHYEFVRMSFGLKSAPLTFQRAMNSIFSGMLGKSIYIYLDDIIIASTDTKSHLDTIKLVSQRLQESGLKVKLTKCEFLKKKKISFLGHDVDGTGLHTSDEDKGSS